jgi:hypothetical protein
MVQPPTKPDSDLIDRDELKERIKDAIRAVIQESADERGLGYQEYLSRYWPEGADDQKEGSTEPRI